MICLTPGLVAVLLLYLSQVFIKAIFSYWNALLLVDI